MLNFKLFVEEDSETLEGTETKNLEDSENNSDKSTDVPLTGIDNVVNPESILYFDHLLKKTDKPSNRKSKHPWIRTKHTKELDHFSKKSFRKFVSIK